MTSLFSIVQALILGGLGYSKTIGLSLDFKMLKLSVHLLFTIVKESSTRSEQKWSYNLYFREQFPTCEKSGPVVLQRFLGPRS